MKTLRLILLSSILTACLMGTAQAGDLVLQAATADHPQIHALLDGRVKVQGCELHLSTHTLESLNPGLAGAKQWDVMEVELVPFLLKQAAGGLSEYELIPVFLSREFQLRNIYIRTDRGIHTAADLRGKTVGVAGYGSTTPTWIRGVLASSWSVKPGEITWVDTETSTRTPRSLSDLIGKGEVDAILSPVPPAVLSEKNAKVARLYTDYHAAEFETFRTSRIFPIITALAIKKTIAEDNSWVSESLFIAFSESKKKAMANMTLPLPWAGQHLQETEELMGKNFWSYGVASNPKTLGALFRYLHDQGLIQKSLKADDVFDPSAMMLLED